MYHRMYIRRCSMSSISEESETGDDDHLDEEFIVCNDNNNNNNNNNPLLIGMQDMPTTMSTIMGKSITNN